MKKIISSVAAGTMMAVSFFGVNAFLMAANEVSGRANLNEEKEGRESVGFDLEVEKAHAQVIGIPDPTCFDNYTSWNSSNTFKYDSEWSTWFVTPKSDLSSTNSNSRIVNNFERDVNGDGLVDYMYVFRAYVSTPFNDMADCLYLSNGNGWELAYKCVAKFNLNPSYYGDCAAT